MPEKPENKHKNQKKDSSRISEVIEEILKNYRGGRLTGKQCIAEIKNIYFEDLGHAKIDHHRALRRGFPEVVFGQGKTPQQILDISTGILKYSGILLITRTSKPVFEFLKSHIRGIVFNDKANLIYTPLDTPEEKLPAGITVLCAGTTDIPVAEEAATTAYLMGNNVRKIYDVGVAGLHRLLNYSRELQDSNVIVAVAGMEGVLPGIVSSMVGCPVIGVPTSIGYGASFAGLSPLLTMLNSCSPGILVTNIDNGFGAGYCAGLINKKYH